MDKKLKKDFGNIKEKLEKRKERRKGRKEKRKQRRLHNWFTYRVMKQENKPKWRLLSLEFMGAFILDALHLILEFIKNIFFAIIIIAVVLFFIVYLKGKPIADNYYKEAKEIVENSTPETFVLSSSSYVYDKDGKVIARLKSDMESNYLKYDKIPSEVVGAFVAVEDRSFWENPGIDVKGLIRVGVNAVKTKGQTINGASTITQQLARNVFLTHERSIERKAKEMLIAWMLTNKYDKEQIIEFYINDICFANAFYGIESASKGYFNKSVSELSLSQIAYLCAIPNSPEYYNPYKNPERALPRRDKILGDMLEMGYITKEEHDKAITEIITVEKPTYEFNNYMTTFAVDCGVKYLMKLDKFEFKYKFKNDNELKEYNELYAEAYQQAKDKLYNGGYHIYTSLDTTKQAEVQSILDKHLNFNQETDTETGIYKLQGAVTIIDNSNGKVVAVIGGRSQENSSQMYTLNRAYQSPRQPGSTIKPLIVYTPALEMEYTPDSVLININVDKAKEPGVDAKKLGGSRITLRRALEQSKNGAAWYLFSHITPNVGLKYITNMKFANIVPGDYNEAVSLGGFHYGATTVEMASAYATIANHGEYREADCILKMIDKNGKDIYKEAKTVEIYDSVAADNVIDVMKGVLTRGTASSLKWSRSTKVEAAAKTGTTNDNKDGWLCGITPYYSIAVWVGYDTPKEMPSLWGNSYPGLIWKDSMLSMLGDIKEGKFEKKQVNNTEGNIDTSNETYMPGRNDDEVLSEGYTVGDYRTDRTIGESVDKLIDKLKKLDINSEKLKEDADKIYKEAKDIIKTIYSTSFRNEKTTDLDSIYNSIKEIIESQEKEVENTSNEVISNEQIE